MISTARSESGPDDEITEDEFKEALRRNRRKDAAPGPDKVRYSDIKNLTEDRTELYAIYQERFDNGHILKDWTHSFLKPILKPGKDHRRLNGYRILTMQNTTGNLTECIVARKLARHLEDRKILPANQGVFRPGKCTLENAAAFAYDVYEGFQRK